MEEIDRGRVWGGFKPPRSMVTGTGGEPYLPEPLHTVTKKAAAVALMEVVEAQSAAAEVVPELLPCILEEVGAGTTLGRRVRTEGRAVARCLDAAVKMIPHSMSEAARGSGCGGSEAALYVVRRRRAAANQHAREHKLKSQTPLEEITNFAAAKSVSPPRLKPRRSTRGPMHELPLLYPPPQNGERYLPNEFGTVAVGLGAGSVSSFIAYAINNGTAPGKRRWCQKVVARALKGIELKDSVGRPPIATEAELTAHKEKRAKLHGRTEDIDDMREFLQQRKKAKLKAGGMSAIGADGVQVSRKTAANYLELYAASDVDMVTLEHAVDKTEVRFAAENSLRSAVSFLHAAAAAHLKPTTVVGNPGFNGAVRSIKNCRLTLGSPPSLRFSPPVLK